VAYFIVIVIFAAVPVTVITTQAVYVMVRYWQSIHLETALDGAEKLAMDHYGLQLEHFEALLRSRSLGLDALMSRGGESSGADLAAVTGTPELLAAQDFWRPAGGGWLEESFAGLEAQRLRDPPALQSGFVPREMPRDRDVIRYILAPLSGDRPGRLRLLSFHLGEGFDGTIAALAEEKTRLFRINNLGLELKPLLILYYGMFFFPTLLMTAIIAISFTRRVAQPLVDLTEATRRVAEGDFSTQIMVRQGDEFGAMVQSFNAMVREFQKSQNALVKAEKISIWQSMAQQLAHEIKNPLTPIKLSAERVLRRWQNEPERVGEILESSMMAIIQEVQGLSRMLTEFRTLSRPLEPSRTWTPLKEALEEIVAPFITPYPQVGFDLDHVDPSVEVRMESRHLNQVLTNLILNSIDAMDSGGMIEFRSDLVKKRESRYCRLSIRDTGKGMNAEEREKVFAPYFTTKDTGTGLGLAIVERIVNDHGGSVWLNSAEGAGTTFFIDFPLDGGGEASPAQAGSGTASSGAGTGESSGEEPA
jgi:nitrogen fixation/metabolism regulation signal transduction histidine kinase